MGSKKMGDVATRFGFYDQNLTVGRLGERGQPVAQSVLGQLTTSSGGDDQPTIALLRHVHQQIVDAPVLVLGTYRDTDLDGLIDAAAPHLRCATNET